MTEDLADPPTNVGLGEVFVQWGRIGCIGFGGPPTHLALLRDLCVTRRRWMDAAYFEDAVATCNLLPGPASTQMAILCAWTVAGPIGAIVGGLAFILPGLVAILALATLFLGGSPPTLVLAVGAGAGAAVAAVAAHAGVGLAQTSWRRTEHRSRWLSYAVIGASAAAFFGEWVVVALLACGATEVFVRRVAAEPGVRTLPILLAPRTMGVAAGAGLFSLIWVAVKVGALSYGGGFVIIPLMQHDAVSRYHWMSNAQFLDAVALGQITPGPVVLTVAVIGFAAAGLAGGVLAAIVAFLPSFMFVLGGASRFERLRTDTTARSFLDGAGPAAIGAILGVVVPLVRSLAADWQYGILAGAAVFLFVLRRSVVTTLLIAAAAGAVLVHFGAHLP